MEKSNIEKGANTGSGFSVSDKKSSSNSDFVSSIKKVQMGSTEAYPSMISVMGTRRQGSNLDRSIAHHEDGDGDVDVDGRGTGGGGGSLGPTYNTGGANEVVGSTYRDDVSSSSGGGGGEYFASGTNLQPFDIFPSSYYPAIPHRSPVGGPMSATVGFPFTSSQWKELERQAMIYKYMISSVPVPPHLLFSLPRDFPTAPDSSVSSYNGRYSRNGDPEPGRCKRTDGKKWRCSRDVAPHQKYCERHLHRGRPRSRKPVEVKNNAESHKKTPLDRTRRTPPTEQSKYISSQSLFVAANEPLLLFNAKTDLSICTPSYSRGADRDLSLMMESEIDQGVDQQWQHLMEANIGLGNPGLSVYSSGGSMFHQDCVENNVFAYPNFPAPEIELPTGFIDAWSIDNVNRRNDIGNVDSSSMSLNEGDLGPSLNLSMAMAAGNVLDQEMKSIQMGVSSVEDCNEGHKTNKDSSSWLSSVSWETFAHGGPLGEALQPGSPYNSISTPATTVSSPSGVLHRALFSHSDGSVCNSPTLAAGAPPPEVAIQWPN